MLWAGCQPQLSGREFGKPGHSGAGYISRAFPGARLPIRHLGSEDRGASSLPGRRFPIPPGLGAQYGDHRPLPRSLELWTAKVRDRHHRMLGHCGDVAKGTVRLPAPKRALWMKHLRDGKRFFCPQCLLILRDLSWAQEFSVLYR